MKRFLRWIYYSLPRIAGTRFMFACRISPYGDMYPCMNYRIGNVCDSSLYSLWTSERYLRFREIFRGGCVRTCYAGCCKLERRTA
jgi:sulfatase maturation enzyme AslB (radical SAM superfamily)